MAKKKTAKKVKKEVKKEDFYKAEFRVLGKVYKSSGVSPYEAIENLEPGKARGKGILTIEHNGRKCERIFMPIMTYRLFNTYGLSRDVVLKNASLMFQGL